MKPILIFAEQKDGTINITKEELQRVVDEAYRQGRADTSSYTFTTPNPIQVTPTWEYNKVTCEG